MPPKIPATSEKIGPPRLLTAGEALAARSRLCFARGMNEAKARVLLAAALTLAPPGSGTGQDGRAAAPPEPAAIAPIPGVPSLRAPKAAPRPRPADTGATGALPLAAGVARTAPERLRPEFQPGLTYRFVVRSEVQTLGPLGGPGGFVLEQQARFDAAVRTDGKNGVVLRARTERLDLSLSNGGRRLDYRSLEAADQDSPLGRHLRASLNRSAELLLDERGRIDRFSEGGPGDDSALLPGLPRFGPEELAALAATLSQGFPERKVARDDGWTLRGARSFAGAGALRFDLSYRHLGPALFEGHNCVAIDFEGALFGNLPEPEAMPEPELRSGGLTGRIHFDPLDRMVRHLEQNVDLWIGQFPPEPPPPADSATDAAKSTPVETADASSAPAAPSPAPFRLRTTVRLLHVVPTP